jgi:lipopolysaccharide transport system ATP-binding protein
MSEALRVEAVSKCFKIQRNRPTSIKESVVRYMTGHRHNHEMLWALRDVSFTVDQGRTLGIIGHNGAGKSTLLRLLCGLGRPTTGRILSSGYVSGLLELGSGLHLDMTGRENILTAGILNGLTKRQILAHQCDIVSFAELEEFIDQPLRTYSSGMYLRLAFSTAIHFDPDVLMIDEVLAVGDSRFQQKCIDRLNVFRKAGKTLVLVSHSIDQIRSLCDEALVLEEGRIATQGDPKSAIECYDDLMRQRSERRAAQLSGGSIPNLAVERGTRLGSQEATISAVQTLDEQERPTDTLQTGGNLTIVLEYSLAKPLSDMAIILTISNETNVKCFETVVASIRATLTQPNEKGSIRCYLPKVPLLAGLYYIDVGLYPIDWNYVYDYHWHMHVLHVESPSGQPPGVSGVISVRPVWSIPTQA